MGLIAKLKKIRSKNGAKKKDKPEEEMSFLEHLEELRWHIMRSLVAIALVGVFIFIYRYEVIGDVLLAPLDGDFPMHRFICWFKQNVLMQENVACLDAINVDLQFISPYEAFLKALTVAFVGGFIVAFPYVLWEVWRFIKPGLHEHERKSLRGNVSVMSMLFFMGVSFGYFIITPFSVQFLANFKLTSGNDNTVVVKQIDASPTEETPQEISQPFNTFELNGFKQPDGTISIEGTIVSGTTKQAVGQLNFEGIIPDSGQVQLNGTFHLDLEALQNSQLSEKTQAQTLPQEIETIEPEENTGPVIENNWRLGNVIGLIIQIALAGGILFELPIMVYYLTKMGLLSPDFMKKYRRHAIVVILILAAIITPPDPLSQLLLFFPLFILYEISLKICKRIYKQREAELAS